MKENEKGRQKGREERLSGIQRERDAHSQEVGGRLIHQLLQHPQLDGVRPVLAGGLFGHALLLEQRNDLGVEQLVGLHHWNGHGDIGLVWDLDRRKRRERSKEKREEGRDINRQWMGEMKGSKVE